MTRIAHRAGRCLAGALIAVALAGLVPADATEGTLRRLVLAAGANNGGVDRRLLRYSVSDAESFVRVLEDMGGLDPADAIVLRDPDRTQFLQGLQELGRRARVAGRQDHRLEVLLYYSGHADDAGLLLAGDRLDYQTLRGELDRTEADVRIAVLDACSSGNITRTKGGQRYQPFLVDESFDMRGYAFLTSSSPDESSQESDAIGASFYTHYLVSGLRGAADATGDGRVTLSEAYQFSFGETLARTTGTEGGVQHPTYDIRMNGTGDVVLTDVRSTTAGLRLGEGLTGRFFIRNAQRQLVAELYKPAGRVVELGLSPGRYDVQLEGEPGLRLATLDLADGERRELGPDDLRAAEREPTAARGQADPSRLDVDDRPAKVAAAGGTLLSLGFLANQQDQPVRGVQVAGLVNQARERAGSQISGVGNLAMKDVKGWQASGMVNWSLGALQGGQVTGGVNISPQVRGWQVAGSTNIAGRMRGCQLSGAVNVGRDFKGAQIGTVNYAGAMKGPQIGVVNLVAPGRTRGAQIGTVNYAREVSGWQVGVVNVAGAGPLRGVQLGNVNVAGRVKGWQVGVVNVSQDIEGVPLGVFSYSHTGVFTLSSWVDELGYGYLTLSSGSRTFYTSFTAGGRADRGERNPAYGFGAGLHRNRAPWYADVDLTEYSLHADEDLIPHDWRDDNQLVRLRVQASRRLGPGLAASVGLSLNLLVADHGQPLVDRPGGLTVEWGSDVSLWPGLCAGLSIGRH